MINEPDYSQASLIPPEPMPAGALDFSKRMLGLMDGKSKNEGTVARALDGFDAMLDAIAAGLYTLASMLVGEGEEGVRLVETAVATAEIPACDNGRQSKMNTRRALVRAALALIEERNPGSLAAPQGPAPVTGCNKSTSGCIEDDDLKASGVSKLELESMLVGAGRDRVRAWLEKLPASVRIVFVLRVVAAFSAEETARLLVAHGGPKAAGWNADSVRSVFRQGLCSLASQVFHATARA